MAVKKFLRCLPALMLLIAPFFAMPLAFLRLTGKAVPLYGLVKLADLYNVSLDYLMGRTANPAPVTA